MEITESNTDLWQVEAGGQVYEMSFDQMAEWIAEGSLLKIDRVRKGNLRWIEAGKVPSLIEFFNAKEAGEPIRPMITTSSTEILGVAEPTHEFVNPPTAPTVEPADVCSVHSDAPAVYHCDTCLNSFCKACPSAYGSTVRICPFCGAMCKSLAQVEQVRNESQKRQRAAAEGFGFGDFLKAFAHPFKFKVSLILGGIMYAIVSLGQGAMSFGGIFMMASAIFCFMLANMLTFGILGNVADNFSQGKLDENFMPSFDDFSLWDDVVHPFFLSIGVYISSFGPLIAVALFAIFMVLGSVKTEMNGLQSDAARTVSPQLPYAANAVQQSDRVRELIKNNANQQQRRVEAVESGQIPGDDFLDRNAAAEQNTEVMVAQANEMINNQRKAQLESSIGKTPEARAKEQAAMISQIMGYGMLFLILGGIALLWGLFYFPAACTVAGYTRSFWATVNPAVGFDTIRRLGSDYVKILFMCLSLGIMSALIGGVLNVVFAAFSLPAVGNLPATFIGSLVTFYFSVVFSCVIGYALFKAADRLELYTAT